MSKIDSFLLRIIDLQRTKNIRGQYEAKTHCPRT